MAKNTALPLRVLVDVNIDNGDQLLDNNSFNRLCIIGKSDNGRGTPFGIYTSAMMVAADYGVEASEYLLARRHFEQFDNGMVLIASADYQSISRPPIVVEPVDPEPPEVDDDEDFVADYISVAYEPIDKVFIEPEPEIPEVPEEPEPEPPFYCIANGVDFNNAKISLLQYDDRPDYEFNITVWIVIEFDGYEHVVEFASITNTDFKQILTDKGAAATANMLFSTLIQNFINDNPSFKNYIYSHTNYAASSFDFGKRFSGIDDLNKADLIETIEYTGATAENFRTSPSKITFKNLAPNVLSSKSRGGIKALNMLDIFNKGEEFELMSCLIFDYLAKVVAPNTACKATTANFNTADNEYLTITDDVAIYAKITVEGVESIVNVNTISGANLSNLIRSNGASFTGNQIMASLLNKFRQFGSKGAGWLESHTNYLLSSFDYSREFGGIDELNKDAFASAMQNVGGRAHSFTNEKSIITFSRLNAGEAASVATEGTTVLNFVDLFNNKKDLLFESCLTFKYDVPKRGDQVIVTPPDDNIKWEPIVVPTVNPPASQSSFNFTTRNNYDYGDFNTVSMPMSLTVKYRAGQNGNFVIKENGVIIFDSAQSQDFTYGARPFYGDYKVHHAIASYDKEINGFNGQVSHSIVFRDNYADTMRDGEPIYAVGSVEGDPDREIIGYVPVYHPLLATKNGTTNYTIEATTGSPFGVKFTLEQEVDPVNAPCVLTVNSFGSHCYNAVFQSYYHTLIVPDYLPAVLNDLSEMFASAFSFNQSLASWDMKYVKNMVGFMRYNPAYSRNLSTLCLSQFDPANENGFYKYTSFESLAAASDSPYVDISSLPPAYYPKFGKCPKNEIQP